MRKRYKKKRVSCKLCKPHKTGMCNKHKPKDEQTQKETEKIQQESVRIDFS